MISNFKKLNKAVEADSCGLIYNPKFREYGLRAVGSKHAYFLIRFCPFTGKKLPGSLRDKWFDEIDKLGLSPESKSMPAYLKSDIWWKNGRTRITKVNRAGPTKAR